LVTSYTENQREKKEMAKIKVSEFDRLESPPKNQKYVEWFEKLFWPNGVISPYDPDAKVWKLKDGYYMCSKTRKKFSVKTVSKELKHSNIPLRLWYLALCFLSSNRGASCRKLGRFLGITHKSAWLLHKDVRSVLKQSNFIKRKLKGIVELDETLDGGKNGNRHWDKKVPHCQGRSHEDKSIIWGAVEINGYLITEVVSNVERKTLEPVIRKYVKEGSDVYTDELLSYRSLGKWYNHQIVNHRIKQYVNGEVTTNSIEGVWSFFKANIKGIHRNNISDKYLQIYMDELTFYFNTREWSEQDRIELMALSLLNKPLTYDEFKQSKYG
jgi:transposase-like protein